MRWLRVSLSIDMSAATEKTGTASAANMKTTHFIRLSQILPEAGRKKQQFLMNFHGSTCRGDKNVFSDVSSPTSNSVPIVPGTLTAASQGGAAGSPEELNTVKH